MTGTLEGSAHASAHVQVGDWSRVDIDVMTVDFGVGRRCCLGLMKHNLLRARSASRWAIGSLDLSGSSRVGGDGRDG